MRQDVYRVAYDEANAELLEITKRFEELKGRKTSLEGVVAVLRPMLGADAPQSQAPVQPAEARPAQLTESAAAQEPANYTFNEAPGRLPEPEEETSDPFQRRVRNALKFSNGNGRDQRGLQPAV
jgi:hypothetical protein